MQEVDWQPPEPVTFWFARHGQSEYNVEDRIGGDSSITAKGQRFADALPALFGRVLQATGEDPRFISVWTSTLLRTIQTASKLPLPQVRPSRLTSPRPAPTAAPSPRVHASLVPMVDDTLEGSWLLKRTSLQLHRVTGVCVDMFTSGRTWGRRPGNAVTSGAVLSGCKPWL